MTVDKVYVNILSKMETIKMAFVHRLLLRKISFLVSLYLGNGDYFDFRCLLLNDANATLLGDARRPGFEPVIFVIVADIS